MSLLRVLYLDNCKISMLDDDRPFSELSMLETLSLANNLVEGLRTPNLEHQYSLIYLNLSRNRISFIENGTFDNLYSLLVLDLSYNSLIKIESYVFYYLTSIRDLYLSDGEPIEFDLYAFSFDDASSLKNIYVSLADVSYMNNKCFLVYSLQRFKIREVNEHFVYYSSVNLITDLPSVYDRYLCGLVFEFIQYDIHFNLKSEEQYAKFYDDCYEFLMANLSRYKLDMFDCIYATKN